MSAGARGFAAALILQTAMGWVAFAQAPKPAAQPAAPPAVATVGPLRIPRDDFEQRAQIAVAEFRRERGAESLPAEFVPVVRRQILESMIRVNLLQLEAKRRGITVTDQQAEAQLKQDPFFTENGVFNQAKFEAIRTTNPQAFANAIRETKERLAARTLSERVEREKRPDTAVLRERARRSLAGVDARWMGLRQAEFAGTIREPREADVLDWYRSHAADFRRPDRAVVSFLFVDQPALADSLAGDASTRTAWMARMRQRADSAQTAVRSGARIEDLAASFGVVRNGVIVLRDNFPGYWRGTSRQAEAVFAAAPGTHLSEPVEAEHGYLVVRVDEMRRAAVAPLTEVSREIRTKLRQEARLHAEEWELRALYDRVRDSLATAGYHVRHAYYDEARMKAGNPKPADLDAYYRSHLADYSAFDPVTGTVQAQPLSEVRDQIAERWVAERKRDLARSAAEKLESAWRKGRRDRGLEREAAILRDRPSVPLGSPADTGAVGRVVGDSLRARGGALGVGTARVPGGVVVFDVVEKVADVVPTFEQAQDQLRTRLAADRARTDERGARALYDQDPLRFATGRTLHYTRVTVPYIDVKTVPLTRAEVERYHRDHLDKYSAPEMVRANHILFEPRGADAAADSEARRRAQSVLDRIRGGADFVTLARDNTDDEATRDTGGDLGAFQRGTMLPEFERVVFKMQPGQVSDVIRTSLGYHIIKCQEYLPAMVQPLVHVYANTAYDAASDKADSLARMRADSLRRAWGTPARGRTAAARLGLRIEAFSHAIGSPPFSAELRPYFDRLETVDPGSFYPGSQVIKGIGYGITWVDSISPPRAPGWEEARPRAVDAYRRQAGERAVDAKQAELDSMLAAGWSLDSLGTLWGGLETLANAKEGSTLPGFGGRAIVDSLLFGAHGSSPLAIGTTSPWVDFPGGPVRIRVEGRREPSATQVESRVEQEARLETERALAEYFEGLKQRYPVKILDPALRAVAMPTTPTAQRR